jgi:hypothetical protein
MQRAACNVPHATCRMQRAACNRARSLRRFVRCVPWHPGLPARFPQSADTRVFCRRVAELALQRTVAALQSELAEVRQQRNELGEALRESKTELQVAITPRGPNRLGYRQALEYHKYP